MSSSMALRRSPKPGALAAQLLRAPLKLIDDQRGERLGFDILGNDQQRTGGLCDLLEQGDQVLECADLPVADEDECILQHGLHLLGVGDEVGRDEAAVELHALHDVECGFGGLGFLDSDDAFVADLLHGFSDEFANDRIIMGRDRCHLRLFLALLDRARQSLQLIDGRLGASLEAALEVYGAGAGDHIAHAIGKYCVCQNDRRAGTIADGLASLLGGLPQHLRAEVLLGILEVELLGDGHAVVADKGHTPFSLDQHGLGFWPQRHPDCIGKLRGATQQLLPGHGPEQNLLMGHGWTTRVQ